MRELICEFCGVRQVYDSRPGARCLNCGGPLGAPLRCYGCRAVIPPNPRCACGLLTVAPDVYPAAVMLAAQGIPLPLVRDRVATLAPQEREHLEAGYRNSAEPLDEALDALFAAAAAVLQPGMLRQTQVLYGDLRASTPVAALLPIVREAIRAYRAMKPSTSPWLHGISKAIHEAAPVKLDQLRRRIGGRIRGLDETSRASLDDTAKRLANGSADDASFFQGAAYLNALLHDHAFIPGEVRDHDPQEIVDLDEASRGREPAEGAVPVSLVRNGGVIWAVGPRPTPDIRDPWVPEGFLYAPFAGEPLPLHEIDGLRAFLTAVDLPIEPLTLAHLVHWMLAPFPWDCAADLEEEGLIDAWLPVEIDARNGARRKRQETTEGRDRLVLRVGGARLTYRRPALDVDGDVPSAKTIVALRTNAPAVESRSVEEIACAHCGVRRSYDPGIACANCGAPAEARTICYGCFEEVPPSPRCPSCDLPTLPRRLHRLALMLRSDGLDLREIAARARSVTSSDEGAIVARYEASWGPADRAIDNLTAALSNHCEPSSVRRIVKAVQTRRWMPDASASEVLEHVGGLINAMTQSRPSIAPFPASICRAIRESAPRRLAECCRDEVPFRGLDGDERDDLSAWTHPAPDPADAAWNARAVYLRKLREHHLFIAGEFQARNDPSPVFELAEAWKDRPGIPVTLVRGRGVIVAEGPSVSEDLLEPWVPTGFVFHGEQTLRLHDEQDLRAFLQLVQLPVTPRTLPFLLHWLLAPFPWGTRVLDRSGLIQRWRNGGPEKRCEPLVLQLEPGGTLVTYEDAKVEIRSA